MNFKSMALSILIATGCAYYQINAVGIIQSDGQFISSISHGKSVIGLSTLSYPGVLEQIIGELGQLQSDGVCPSANFYAAYSNNIPKSVQRYHLEAVGVVVFNNGAVVGQFGFGSVSQLAGQISRALNC